MTLPGTISDLRGAPQPAFAPEEDLSSPLPGNSASPPIAVAVPLPYLRPQQKPWFVVETNDDTPIGLTKPIFPDGTPVAAVKPVFFL